MEIKQKQMQSQYTKEKETKVCVRTNEELVC